MHECAGRSPVNFHQLVKEPTRGSAAHHDDAIDALLQELDGAHKHVEALRMTRRSWLGPLLLLLTAEQPEWVRQATARLAHHAYEAHDAFPAPTLSKVSWPSTGRIVYRAAPVSASRYLTTFSCSFSRPLCMRMHPIERLRSAGRLMVQTGMHVW